MICRVRSVKFWHPHNILQGWRIMERGYDHGLVHDRSQGADPAPQIDLAIAGVCVDPRQFVPAEMKVVQGIK